MRLGAHLSIAKGWEAVVTRAEDLGCETVQVFSRSPRGGKPKLLSAVDMERFQGMCKEAGISPLSVHVPYFVNLGAEKGSTWDYSVATLTLDLQRAHTLGAQFVVTHLGRYKTDARQALANSLAALEAATAGVVGGVKLLVEVSAGHGREIGFSLEELAYVAQRFPGERLGFCLDTAHLHAAGYDVVSQAGLGRFLSALEAGVGLDRVELVHLNDAVYPRGHKRDRHASIGEGELGRDGFKRFINHPDLRHLPGIIETPARSHEDHRRDLDILRELREDPLER